eukprot:scaffold2554_cov321-Prasinococcus_capsulatus_cf.AAC.4
MHKDKVGYLSETPLCTFTFSAVSDEEPNGHASAPAPAAPAAKPPAVCRLCSCGRRSSRRAIPATATSTRGLVRLALALLQSQQRALLVLFFDPQLHGRLVLRVHVVHRVPTHGSPKRAPCANSSQLGRPERAHVPQRGAVTSCSITKEASARSTPTQAIGEELGDVIGRVLRMAAPVTSEQT